MAKMKGLGRGLDALLGGADEVAAAPGETLATLAVDVLQPGRFQPRLRLDQAALAGLADSIKAQGVMQPILARPLGDGRYEIVAGERRWRAAHLARLTIVPALVRELPDRSALALALIENIQREDLNPLDEAAGLKRLLEEFGMTHADAAEALDVRARPSRTQCGCSSLPHRSRNCCAKASSTWGTPARCSACRCCARSNSLARRWPSN